MADYIANARTNYFRVKDEAEFMKWLDNYSSEIGVLKNEDNGTMFRLTCETDHGDWPTSLWSDESDEPIEVDITVDIAPYLAEGSVAVFMESGSERGRYIGGWATAVNSKGEQRIVALHQIWDLAKELGTEVDIC